LREAVREETRALKLVDGIFCVGDLIGQGCAREEVEKRVDMLPFLPVEEGRNVATASFVALRIGRMYDQLMEPLAK
jgi:hypothetical protein